MRWRDQVASCGKRDGHHQRQLGLTAPLHVHRGRDEPRQQQHQELDREDDEGISFETSKSVKVIHSFDKMGLRDDLLRGIYAYGFEKPSAIQQRAIKPIVEGRDVIAQAQSGTGKTSMIAVAVCQKLDTKLRE